MNYLLRIGLPPFETQLILVSTSHRLQVWGHRVMMVNIFTAFICIRNDWLTILVGRGPNYSFCVFFPNIYHCEEISVYQKLHRRNCWNRRFLCGYWTWGRVLSREMGCSAMHGVLLPPVAGGRLRKAVWERVNGG